MKTKSPKPPTFRKLMTQIRPLAEQLQTLNNQAGALGLFTEDRELLTCPRCGLEEDVSASGLLLTCRSASDGQDNGLRFRLVGEGRFRCPSCGQIVHAPLPERQSIGCPLTTRETKRMAARTATDGRRLEARPIHRRIMSKSRKSVIEVKGTAITVLSSKDEDFISLTDMLKAKDGDFFISDWLRNRNTVEFLGIWESVHNPEFNYGEFATIKGQAGLNSYKISVKEWVEKTNAIGLRATAGRYGGTFAHKDIAFEFGMWISPEFKIYLIKEFQRLKDDENRRLSLAWNLNRTLSKLNYRIHTDAVKAHLVPPEVTPAQAALTYANEADLLNVALFGQTARQWRDANPKLDANTRDHATIEQLLVLANLEGMNAEFIHMNLPQGERLKRLNQIAIRQMQTLTASAALRQLEPPQDRK